MKKAMVPLAAAVTLTLLAVSAGIVHAGKKSVELPPQSEAYRKVVVSSLQQRGNVISLNADVTVWQGSKAPVLPALGSVRLYACVVTQKAPRFTVAESSSRKLNIPLNRTDFLYQERIPVAFRVPKGRYEVQVGLLPDAPMRVNGEDVQKPQYLTTHLVEVK